MKRLVSATALLALLAPVAASGADLYQPGASTKDGAVLAGNPFAGFNGSVGVGVASLGEGGRGDQSWFRADGRAGYNFVSKEGFLIGVWGEVSLLDVPDATNSPFLGYGAGVKLGKVLSPQLLAYIDGGYDAIEVSNQHIDGYKVGGGLEYLITSRWSIGPEINYVNYNGGEADGVHATIRTTLYLGN